MPFAETTEGKTLGSGFIAGVDLSSKKGFGVKQDASGQVVLAGLNDKDLMGVLLNQPKVGDACFIAGVDAVVQAQGNGGGAAITTGDKVGTDANGMFVKKSAANDVWSAIAQEGLSGSGPLGIRFVGAKLDAR